MEPIALIKKKMPPHVATIKDFLTDQYEIAERVGKKINKPIGIQQDLNRNFHRPQASSKNNLNRSFFKKQTFASEQYKQTSC